MPASTSRPPAGPVLRDCHSPWQPASTAYTPLAAGQGQAGGRICGRTPARGSFHPQVASGVRGATLALTPAMHALRLVVSGHRLRSNGRDDIH